MSRLDSSENHEFLVDGVLVGTIGSSGMSFPAGSILNILQANAPATPANGDIWVTSTGMYARVAGATVGPMGSGGGGGGMTNPMTTAGDIIYGLTGGTPARLGITANGFLYGAAAAPAWTASADLGWNNTTKVLSVGGQIGMGTTPATDYKLDMSSSALAITRARLATSNASSIAIFETTSPASVTRLYAIGSTYRVGNGNALDSNSTSVVEGTPSNGLNLVASTASADIRFFAGGTTDGAETGSFQRRMTIKGNSGHVTIGMGETTPTYRLDVLHRSSVSALDTGIRFRNTLATNARSVIICEADVATITLSSYSSSYVIPSDDGRRPNSASVSSTGAGGLAIVAGAGSMNFYVGGPATAQHAMIIGSSNRNVGIGGYSYSSQPTYTLSFGGNAARTIGMERKSSASGPGLDLTVSAGDRFSSMFDGAGGSLVLAGGLSSGRNQSLVRLQGCSSTTATGDVDNTRLDRLITGLVRTQWHSSTALLCTALPASLSGSGLVITGTLELYGNANDKYYVSTFTAHLGLFNNSGTVLFSGPISGSQPVVGPTASPPLVTVTINVTNTGDVTLAAALASNPWVGGIVTSRFTYNLEYFGRVALTNLFQM